jgi:hypothetical protein
MGTYCGRVSFPLMTQERAINQYWEPAEDARQEALAAALEEAPPPFNLPPLPKSRRAEIRVPASINGRDLSRGQP